MDDLTSYIGKTHIEYKSGPDIYGFPTLDVIKQHNILINFVYSLDLQISESFTDDLVTDLFFIY